MNSIARSFGPVRQTVVARERPGSVMVLRESAMNH